MKLHVLAVVVGTSALALLNVGCPPPERCDGPDPRAMAINYEKLSEIIPMIAGRVRITGVCDNHGRFPYVSAQGQQSLQLIEDGGGVVAEVDFQNLAVDEQIAVSFERDWNTANEFRPASYTLQLVYDPDIYIDGNESNDDCNTQNNVEDRTTEGLDALF